MYTMKPKHLFLVTNWVVAIETIYIIYLIYVFGCFFFKSKRLVTIYRLIDHKRRKNNIELPFSIKPTYFLFFILLYFCSKKLL